MSYLEIQPNWERAKDLAKGADYQARRQFKHPLEPFAPSVVPRLRESRRLKWRFYWVSFARSPNPKSLQTAQKALACRPLTNREISFRLFENTGRPFYAEGVEFLLYLLSDQMLEQGQQPRYPQAQSKELAQALGVQAARSLSEINQAEKGASSGFWVCPAK